MEASGGAGAGGGASSSSNGRVSGTGGGIVVYYKSTDNKHYVLVGKESKWLREINPTITLDGKDRPLAGAVSTDPANLEYSAQGSIDFAKMDFTGRAARLSVALKKRIQFDQPVAHSSGKGWTTNYRFLPDAFKYGVPKGGSNPSEVTRATALREFGEEIGLALDPSIVTGPIETVDHYDFYRVDCSKELKGNIEAAVAGRAARHYSELFDIEFMLIETALALERTKINGKSRAAIEALLPLKGGSREEPNKNAFLNRMIQIHSVEQRTMVQSGQPPITIVRQVDMKNGHGVKQVQVIRGNTVLAQESATLNLTEKKNVQNRKTSSLHKSLERKTLKRINASKKQVATQGTLNASKKKAATKQRAAKTRKVKAKKAAKKN